MARVRPNLFLFSCAPDETELRKEMKHLSFHATQSNLTQRRRIESKEPCKGFRPLQPRNLSIHLFVKHISLAQLSSYQITKLHIVVDDIGSELEATNIAPSERRTPYRLKVVRGIRVYTYASTRIGA